MGFRRASRLKNNMDVQKELLLLGILFRFFMVTVLPVVSEVRVHFLFEWPLVFIILGSALAGVWIRACFTAVKIFKYKREVGQL